MTYEYLYIEEFEKKLFYLDKIYFKFNYKINYNLES